MPSTKAAVPQAVISATWTAQRQLPLVTLRRSFESIFPASVAVGYTLFNAADRPTAIGYGNRAFLLQELEHRSDLQQGNGMQMSRCLGIDTRHDLLLGAGTSFDRRHDR